MEVKLNAYYNHGIIELLKIGIFPRCWWWFFWGPRKGGGGGGWVAYRQTSYIHFNAVVLCFMLHGANSKALDFSHKTLITFDL